MPDSRFNPLDHPICFELPRAVEAVAWQEHIPFAMLLVELLRPKVLVELGVHKGDSYLAFCQAVSACKSDTACYGVDTWKGDAHAGFYGDEVLADLRRHHDGEYGKFSRLVQSTFDEAATYFPDASIDLLHIDGLHTYEAVSHDWQVWSAKLKPDAVALFHDVNVRENSFGVWKFWQEVSATKRHMTFKHGHGLGVLAMGDVPAELGQLLAAEGSEAAALDALFFALGRRITDHVGVQRLNAHAAYLEQLVREREKLREKETRELLERARESERALSARDTELEKVRKELREAIAKGRELEAALTEMASSTAVRTARMLRTVSPRLQSVAASIGKVFTNGQGR
jgi:hypothetical protein